MPDLSAVSSGCMLRGPSGFDWRHYGLRGRAMRHARLDGMARSGDMPSVRYTDTRARTEERSVVCFAFAQTAVAQFASCQCADGQMRPCAMCSVDREPLLSCLTQLTEGSNLAQTVSVGCCR